MFKFCFDDKLVRFRPEGGGRGAGYISYCKPENFVIESAIISDRDVPAVTRHQCDR